MTAVTFPTALENIAAVAQPGLDALPLKCADPCLPFPDTITAAEVAAPAFIPSRPTLTPPFKQSEELALIILLDKISKVERGLLKVSSEELSRMHKQFEALYLEKTQKLKESIGRNQISHFWDLLKRIGACIVAAISTVLGIALVTTGAGTVVGGVMIACGVTTLANLALSEAGVWRWAAEKIAGDNEEKCNRIATLIPAAIGLLTFVGGAIGSGGATLFGQPQLLGFGQMTLTIVKTAADAAEGIATVGEGVTKARMHWTQADLNDLEGKLTLHQHHFETSTQELQKLLHNLSDTYSKAQRIITLATQNSKRIMIQG